MNPIFRCLLWFSLIFLVSTIGLDACTTQKSCTEDSICDKGQICLRQFCVTGCRKTSDCPKGEACNLSICTPNTCEPGTTRSCFDGSKDVLEIGTCRAGLQFCTVQGVWSRCSGQRKIQPEICDRLDNNCDGQVDNGISCSCVVGEKRACFSGSSTNHRKGFCKSGVQYCASDNRWGACHGQILPSPEICDGKDNDCNGQIDEADVCKCIGARSCSFESPAEKSVDAGPREGIDSHETLHDKHAETQADASPLTVRAKPVYALLHTNSDSYIEARAFFVWGKDGNSPEFAIAGIARGPIEFPMTGAKDTRIDFGSKKSDFFVGVYLPKSNAWKWIRRIQVQSTQTTRYLKTLSIAMDTSRNTWLSGSFDTQMTFKKDRILKTSSSMDSDVFVAKWNALGVPQWARQIGVKKQADEGVKIRFAPKLNRAVLLANLASSSTAQGVEFPVFLDGEQISSRIQGPSLLVMQLDTTGKRIHHIVSHSVVDKFTLGKVHATDLRIDDQGSLYITGSFWHRIRFHSKSSNSGFSKTIATEKNAALFVASFDITTSGWKWVKQLNTQRAAFGKEGITKSSLALSDPSQSPPLLFLTARFHGTIQSPLGPKLTAGQNQFNILATLNPSDGGWRELRWMNGPKKTSIHMGWSAETKKLFVAGICSNFCSWGTSTLRPTAGRLENAWVGWISSSLSILWGDLANSSALSSIHAVDSGQSRFVWVLGSMSDRLYWSKASGALHKIPRRTFFIWRWDTSTLP